MGPAGQWLAVGGAAPRIAMWSHNEPVTLFGALLTRSGWREPAPAHGLNVVRPRAGAPRLRALHADPIFGARR